MKYGKNKNVLSAGNGAAGDRKIASSQMIIALVFNPQGVFIQAQQFH
jgi:hypothetical protein